MFAQWPEPPARSSAPPLANPNSILRRFMARIPSLLENHCGRVKASRLRMSRRLIAASSAEKTCSSRRRPLCVNHIYSVYIRFQAMQMRNHSTRWSCGGKHRNPLPRGKDRKGANRLDMLDLVQCGYAGRRAVERGSRSRDRLRTFPELAVLCSVLFIFLADRWLAETVMKKACDRSSVKKRCGDNLTGRSKRRSMPVKADGGRERPEKSRGGR